jgi:hypothetical protein
MLLYSSEAEALRALLRDAFGFKAVDAGGGLLIFALPPAELGVHPAEALDGGSSVHHQLSFMCDNIQQTITELRTKGVQFEGDPKHESYGITMMMTLPGGVRVMLYEPRHATTIALPA